MTAVRRAFLVVAHTGRDDSTRAARQAVELISGAGVEAVIADPDTRRVLGVAAATLDERGLDGIELAVVLGGDGTILRAAELVRDTGIPIIGVNLGHVGFLAEVEREDLVEVVRRAVARDYEVEERMTLDVVVRDGSGRVVERTWALNEATVEKAMPGKMIEVVIAVDERPLSSFGCDGVVLATPTGSTAYAFSAGGPVVWPDIDALLLVPLSAHALFARPLVVAPTSVLAVQVRDDSAYAGVLWCDGRRGFELEPGARVEATRSRTPVRLARLSRGVFTDRLVGKFDLPVTGWRGSGR